MDDEMLIELVRCHEELYNQGDRLYFDAIHKNKLWKDISIKLNKTPEECKQRWESLRSQYRKICKARETKTGQAAIKRKKWRYEEELAFLLPYMKDKERISSFPDIAENASDMEHLNEDSIHDENEGGNGEAEQNTSQSVSTTPVSVPSTSGIITKKSAQKKTTRTSKESASAVLMQYILSKKEEEQREPQNPKKDHIDLFFDSIKATVRNFSPADYQLAKRIIFNTVSDIENKYIVANENTRYQHQQPSSSNLLSGSGTLRSSGFSGQMDGAPLLHAPLQVSLTPISIQSGSPSTASSSQSQQHFAYNPLPGSGTCRSSGFSGQMDGAPLLHASPQTRPPSTGFSQHQQHFAYKPLPGSGTCRSSGFSGQMDGAPLLHAPPQSRPPSTTSSSYDYFSPDGST
uniref:Uncharacterized protein LOC114327210 n=1 Tax=Diabrotica virgifera virgifera TaxID=50390 RepID=A0A6P7F6Y0_DIAVI